MALRILPLGSGGPAKASTGLRIQPLGDLLLSLPTVAALASETGATPLWRGPQTSPDIAYAMPGGGEGVGAGSGSISGMSGADIATSFGHLAGPSPLSAAFTGLAPSFATSIVGLGPTTTTPAHSLSNAFSFAPAPTIISAPLSMLAHAMQQSEINTAVAKHSPIVHNEQDLATLGSSQGMSTAAINAALGMTGGPNVANSIAQGLGLTGGQLASLSNAAPFGGPTVTISGPDADAAPPGPVSGPVSGMSDSDSDGNAGAGGGGGGGGSHLCTWAVRLLNREKETTALRDSLVVEFARKYPDTWKKDFKEYQQGATQLLGALKALPAAEQRSIAERVYREVMKPYMPTVEPDEVDDVVKALERVGFALAKEQKLEIPKALLEFSTKARAGRISGAMAGTRRPAKRQPLAKAMGASA
jgi:hypothetical protein